MGRFESVDNVTFCIQNCGKRQRLYKCGINAVASYFLVQVLDSKKLDQNTDPIPII